MVYYTCLRPVKSVRNYDSIATYSEHLSEVLASKVLVNLDMCSKIVLDLTRRIPNQIVYRLFSQDLGFFDNLE